MNDSSRPQSSFIEDDNKKGLKLFLKNIKEDEENSILEDEKNRILGDEKNRILEYEENSLFEYEENSIFEDDNFNGFKNFFNKKESKPILTLKREHENSIKYIFQMNFGGFIVIQKIKKQNGELLPFNYEDIIITKTDLSTGNIEKIISKNIENKKIKETKNEIKNKILFKDIYYNNQSEYILINDDIKPLIFEIKENIFNYAIICGNHFIYKIFYNNNFKSTKIDIDINIYLILQIRGRNNIYIISCDKGLYYYEGSIFEIKSEKLLKENLISKKPYKHGVVIDDRYAFFFDNEDRKGYIYIYDTFDKVTKKSYDKYIKNSYYPFIEETLSVIIFEENKNKKTVVLCACEKGILLIKKEKDNIKYICENYCDINFNIKFICPLKDFKIENNITELIDTEYIIVVGENDNKMELRLYKIEGLENNSIPIIIKDNYSYLFTKENVGLEGMSYIVQSKKKGNFIITYQDKSTKELYFIDNNE